MLLLHCLVVVQLEVDRLGNTLKGFEALGAEIHLEMVIFMLMLKMD